MLFLKLCCLGLLLPSFANIGTNEPVPARSSEAQRTQPERIRPDPGRSVRYVVQKTPASGGQATELRFAAEYYGAKALGPEGVWKLKNGITVAGQAFETPDVDVLQIKQANGGEPTEVYVRLEDFADSDLAQLKKVMSKFGGAVRYQHLPLIGRGIKRWKATPPEYANALYRIVAVEGGEIFAVTPRRLLVVPESAVDPAEVAELKREFDRLGSGRYLEVTKFTPAPFAGKLLAETDDCFVLETGETSQSINFHFPKGTRYRIPKYLLSDLLTRQLQAVLKRYAKEQAGVHFNSADLLALPCARLTGVGIGLRLCFPATEPNAEFVEILTVDGTRQRLVTNTLSCTDRIHFEYEALIHSGETPSTALHDVALLTVADGLSQRRVWQLKGARPVNIGAPLGAIGDGFAFAVGQGKKAFFVKARQLEDVDRKLLQIAFQRERYKWLWDTDPEQLFKSRVILVRRHAYICAVEDAAQYDGALQGKYARLKSLDSPKSIDLNGVHVDSLYEASDADGYINQYAPLVASNNRAAAIQKIAALRQTSQEPLPDLNQHVPTLKREAWHVRGDKAGEFYGTLAGKWGEDFVFYDEFDGTRKHFLAASTALSDDSRERAEQLAARMPAQAWQNIVSKAANWQYFRILYSAESEQLLSASPSVILELRSFGPALQNIEGKTHTLLWAQVGGEERGRAMLERALKDGLANREKAEQGVPKWTFQDSSEALVAQFVGEYGDDVLLRDASGSEFLMFKMSFDETSLQQLARLSKETAKQPQLTLEERYQLPRMWCSYDQLLGPARLLAYVEMSQAWMLVKDPAGNSTPMALSSLTRRERLATTALWLRQHQRLEDDRSFDALLSKPVANNEVIRQTPALLAAIKQRIDQAWQVHLTELTWQAKPIELDAQAKLIAVDRDATGGIVSDATEKWQAVDFTSGKQQSLQELFPQAPKFGPWLYRGIDQVWWIEAGELKTWKTGGQVSVVLPESKLTITLADQSGDFESLVLHFSDDSISKLELATGRVQQLRPAPHRIMPPEGARLAASLDGSAVMMTHHNSVSANVFPRAPDEAEGRAFAGVAQPFHAIAVSRKLAVGTYEDLPQLFAMSAAVQGVRPGTLSVPFVPQVFGFVKLGPDGEEEFQAIGKPNDKFSRASDWAFVYLMDIDGQRRKHQIIEGEFDKNAMMAGNGAAVVHKKQGRYVVSRRPAEIPLNFRNTLYKLATELVEKLDIGQLEAVTRYLQQPPFLTECAYPGETADAFFDLLWVSCLQFQPQVGGDRMERARLAIEKMLERFPKSHTARNLLVAWHRDCAWEARGGGYADTVSKKGWEIFHTHFQKAQKELRPLLGQPDTIAATYRSAIDIATATGASLESMRKFATEILRGPHAANADVHTAIMQYLLPRWHGEPGMSEAYAVNVAKQLGGSRGDAMYAKMIAEISRFQGPTGIVTGDMDLDFDRLFRGTKDYYAKWNSTNVMDLTLVLLHVEQRTDQVEELLRLRADKHILPGGAARGGWKTFQAIEASIEED